MASPHIIDIDELLKPVTDEQPQGEDIRVDGAPTSIYAQIKNARNKARAAERAALFDPDQAADIMAEWKPILSLAPTILKEHAKDLEVASWLIEALIRFHDFAGLRDGIQLTRGLIDQYWDNVYPEPDEDGIETKVAALAGLNGDSGEGTLLAPIRNSLITPDSSVGSFSYWQYQQARDADKISDLDKRDEKFASLGFTLKDIETAVVEAPNTFYQNLTADLNTCLSDFRAMNDTLRQHCGHEAPPYTLILETLEEVLRTVRFLAKEKLAVAEEDIAHAQTETAASAAGATRQATGGPISSREDALRRLDEVAQFFRRTEPHTPLVSGIERLVRWGRMPMSELILELVPDPIARAFYQHLTGANLQGDEDASTSYAATAGTGTSHTEQSSDSSEPAGESSGGLRW